MPATSESAMYFGGPSFFFHEIQLNNTVLFPSILGYFAIYYYFYLKPEKPSSKIISFCLLISFVDFGKQVVSEIIQQSAERRYQGMTRLPVRRRSLMRQTQFEIGRAHV